MLSILANNRFVHKGLQSVLFVATHVHEPLRTLVNRHVVYKGV